MGGIEALMELPEDLLIKILQNIHPRDSKVIGAVICANKRLGSLLKRTLRFSGMVTSPCTAVSRFRGRNTDRHVCPVPLVLRSEPLSQYLSDPMHAVI